MYLNEEKVWINKSNGLVQNLFDFVKTRDYIPRIYDYETKNTSFFNMSKLLKELGIKNYNECLQLFNPLLKGVDTHSTLLTNEMKAMIDRECRMNPWYAIREVYRVSIGTKKTYFDLNLSNYTSLWLMMRCQDYFQIAPRQTGKTHGAASFIAWVINFGGKGLSLSNIHYDEKKAKDNINKIREVLDNLPPYLQYHKKDIAKVDSKTGKTLLKNRIDGKGTSTRDLENKLFSNKISTVVVGQEEEKAKKSGRGNADEIIFIDEYPFIKYNFHMISTIGQSTSTARKLARENGIINGIWTLGTPGFLNTEHGKWIWENTKSDYIHLNVNNLFIFDFNVEELTEWRNTQGINTFFYIDYTYEIMGYDEDWLFEKGRSETPETIIREILIEWSQSSSDNPFNRNLLNALSNKAKLIKGITAPFRGEEFLLYHDKKDPYKGNSIIDFFKYNYKSGIVVGVDIAYGYGGNRDKSTMVFIDKRTARVIATYGNNAINVDDYLILIMTLMEEFKRHNIIAAFVIERNSAGESIIAALKKIPEYQKFLVAFPVSESKLADPTSIIDTNVIYGDKRIPSDYGFRVTGGKNGSRGVLMSILSTLVEKYTDCISIPVIVNEILTLTVNQTKTDIKIEASEGCHDDYIMAMLHAYNAIFNNSKFLSVRNFIEIDTNTFLINDNMQIVDVTGTVKNNRRIQPIYEQHNGKIEIRYFDTVDNKYIEKSEAQIIQRDEFFSKKIKGKGNDNNTDGYKEAVLIDDDNFNIGRRNIKLLTEDDVVEEYKENDVYDTFSFDRDKLRDNINLFDQNLRLESGDTKVMEELKKRSSNSIFNMFNVSR